MIIVNYMRRDERGEQKSMINYIAVNNKLKKDVLDIKVVSEGDV